MSIHNIPNEPKTRKVIIPIRFPTPSRSRIVIIVAQSQDLMHRWETPIITFEGPVGPFFESGRYVRDLGLAFIVAAYWFDQFMLDVKAEYPGNDSHAREETNGT